MTVTQTAAVRWESATFSGMRHALTLTLPADAAAERWLARLADVDLPLRGHLVADLTVRSIHRAGGTLTAGIEALTVES